VADGARYSIETIDRLVGGWWVDSEGVLREHEAQWAAVRSYTEHHGSVESDGWLEVLDEERALAALARRHPLGALAVMALHMGWDQDELKAAFSTLRMPVSTLLKKSTAFMQAWLSGDVDRWERAESAWKRARRREGLTPYD
jgi:hypothetical protein